MTEFNHSPQAVLREEILAQARRQAGDLVSRARQEADALRAKAAAAAETTRRERLEAGRTNAARQRELILSAVPLETNRRRLARIESLLQAIHDDARRRLADHDTFDYREALAGLAADAVSRMVGETFVLTLSPAERAAFGEGFAEDVARRVGRAPLAITVVEEATMTEGGVMVQDAEGRQIWDNRLLTRLERLWPELRQQLAVRTGLAPEGEGS